MSSRMMMMNDVVTYLLVAIGATLIPAPFDPLHFYLQNYMYRHRQSRRWFEFLQIIDWYAIDASYFVLLLGIVLLFNIENMANAQAFTTVATILGVGAAVSIIWRFLRKR